MQAENPSAKSVLVFLRPLRPSKNFNVHAWQHLELSSGAEATFKTSKDVSVSVEVTGYKNASLIASHPVRSNTHQLLDATSSNGLSPRVSAAPRSESLKYLMTSQHGVTNKTNPGQTLSCCWYVGGCKVVSMPDQDVGMICTFEYEPALYFMVASPVINDENYTVQCFSRSVKYTPPTSASVIDVIVTKNESQWNFDFNVVPDYALNQDEYSFAKP